ncbi:MAG: 30S ribosomal protein S20 [Kiritimatiellia bacterium]
MPNIKSAIKRQKQSVERTARNKVRKSRIATAKRKMLTAIQMGDTAKSESSYREFCSALDKAAKLGVIKSNKADRSKSRAVKALAKAKA